MLPRTSTNSPIHRRGDHCTGRVLRRQTIVAALSAERALIDRAAQSTGKPARGEGPMLTHADLLPVYLLRAVYVLHCFPKKSPSGIRTARDDVRLVHDRLRAAQDDYEVRYGSE